MFDPLIDVDFGFDHEAIDPPRDVERELQELIEREFKELDKETQTKPKSALTSPFLACYLCDRSTTNVLHCNTPCCPSCYHRYIRPPVEHDLDTIEVTFTVA